MALCFYEFIFVKSQEYIHGGDDEGSDDEGLKMDLPEGEEYLINKSPKSPQAQAPEDTTAGGE